MFQGILVLYFFADKGVRRQRSSQLRGCSGVCRACSWFYRHPLTKDTIRAPCPNLRAKMYFNFQAAKKKQRPIPLRSQARTAFARPIVCQKHTKPIWRIRNLYFTALHKIIKQKFQMTCLVNYSFKRLKSQSTIQPVYRHPFPPLRFLLRGEWGRGVLCTGYQTILTRFLPKTIIQ